MFLGEKRIFQHVETFPQLQNNYFAYGLNVMHFRGVIYNENFVECSYQGIKHCNDGIFFFQFGCYPSVNNCSTSFKCTSGTNKTNIAIEKKFENFQNTIEFDIDCSKKGPTELITSYSWISRAKSKLLFLVHYVTI